MFRKLISILLVLGLMAGLLVIPVSAETTHEDHCVCGGGAEGVYDHVCATVQWQPLPEGTTDFGKLASGHYYLTGDVAVTAASNIVAGVELSICLNGHNITSSNTRVFGYTLRGSVLNICDCAGGGTVTAGAASGKYGCVLYTMSQSTANIFGGSFTSLSTNAANGSVFLAANDSCDDYNGDGTVNDTDKAYAEAASTLNIYGGNIYSSVSTTGNGGTIGHFHNPIINIHGGTISGGGSKSGGGNIYANRLTVTGGTITGGKAATVGGNIRCKTAATITGGTISDGVAGNNGGNIYAPAGLTITGGMISGGTTENYQGGNIYCTTAGTLTVTGGTITGGSSPTAGGGIYVTKAVTVNISGDPVIDGNDRGNLYLARTAPTTFGQMTEGAKVGVLYADTWHKSTVTHTPTEDITNYIYSDSPEAYFTFSGTTMKQTAKSQEYTAGIEALEYFDNTVEEALPMTVIYKLIDDHFEAPLPEGKTEKKVIFIGYDAVRTDALEHVTDQNSAIFSVAADGGLYHSYAGGEYGGATQQMTVTSVGWTTMFTGMFARTHGVTANHSSTINANVHLITTELAEKGNSVLLIGDTLTKEQDEDGNYITFFPEHWMAEMAYMDAKNLDITFSDTDTNQADLLAAIAQADMPDVIWYYQNEPDNQGHDKGWGSHIPEYVAAVQEVDSNGYDIYQAIKARPTYEQEDWLVIVSTDHGGYLTQHGEHSAQERSTWIAVNKTIDCTDEGYSAYDRINELTGDHSHCSCGTGLADHTCAEEQWTPWYDADNLPTTSGNYYLMTDVDVSSMTSKIDLAIDVEQKLCLNGHTITGPTSDISLWWVRNYFSICDCVGTGKIDLSSDLAGPLLHVFSSGTVSEGLGGTFELFGGTVTSTGKAQNAGGGIVYVGNSGENKAIFNMYGGILQGGSTVKEGGAVNVGVKNAVFNMYGGTIRNCSSDTYGGAVYVGSTTRQFNMYGGTIENSTATTCGGNVYAYGIMNMYGGTIQGGIANEGGSLGIGGNGVVAQYGGTIKDGGFSGSTVTTVKGGNVMIFGTYKLYGGTVEGGKSTNNGGNICSYNAAGFEIQKTADSITDPTVQNGQSNYGGNVYYGGGTAKPAYTIGDGAIITGGTTTSGEGGNVWVGAKYTVNMYGGTIKNGGLDGKTSQGGNMFLYGIFNMYGGTVKDGKAKQGGNISGWSSYTINMAKSELSTTVPTISGGTATTNGGNVILRGTAPTMNISYGLITGGNSGLYVSAGTLNLSGTAQVTGNTQYNILLASGFTLNAENLETGAAFGVTMADTTGQFTASTQEGFFTADDRALLVVQKTDGLYLATAVAQAGEQRFASVQEAVNSGNAVQLLADVTEDVVLTGSLYLDLNGKVLTGNITGGTLYGLDSATNDYTSEGAGRITGTVENVAKQFQNADGKRYLAIADGTGYSFHRFYLGITHANLKPNAKGVGYKAVFAGSDLVKEHVSAVGYSLVLEGNDPVTRQLETFVSLEPVTLRVENYDAEKWGTKGLTAQVYMVIDGQTVYSNACTYSLQQLVETVNENHASYTSDQLAAIAAWINSSETMQSWKTENLYTA